MLPELTPAVARVLEQAQMNAQRLGMSEILSIYLLHALLAEEEGRACLLATAAGLDATAFQASRAVPAHPGAPPQGGREN
ncbi:MAG TPA: Clp protease N-terminal domain-containing protein, partial [Gemmataceae bacterium]